MLKNCTHCSKPYKLRPYRFNKSFYCSLRCKAIKQMKRFERPCEICGIVFSYISFREGKAKYCSNKCYYKSQTGRGLTAYQCRYCSKKFNGSLSKKRVYCSRKCVNKCRKTLFKPKYTTVRKAMLTRGQIKNCEICGYDAVPQILGIHHKDGNRKNNHKENLQVVCPMCHSLAHRKHISH